jgi:hypothetical protein
VATTLYLTSVAAPVNVKAQLIASRDSGRDFPLCRASLAPAGSGAVSSQLAYASTLTTETSAGFMTPRLKVGVTIATQTDVSGITGNGSYGGSTNFIYLELRPVRDGIVLGGHYPYFPGTDSPATPSGKNLSQLVNESVSFLAGDRMLFDFYLIRDSDQPVDTFQLNYGGSGSPLVSGQTIGNGATTNNPGFLTFTQNLSFQTDTTGLFF